MPTDNLALLQDGYAAFAASDLVRPGELFAPTHHLARARYAVTAVGGLPRQTGGVRAVRDAGRPDRRHLPRRGARSARHDTHGVGLVIITATRADGSLTVNQVNVLHLSDSKVTEGWIASTDQQAEDEFWA